MRRYKCVIMRVDLFKDINEFEKAIIVVFILMIINRLHFKTILLKYL